MDQDTDPKTGCFRALLPTFRRNKRTSRPVAPPAYIPDDVLQSQACPLDGPADFAYALESSWWRDDKPPPYHNAPARSPAFVHTVNDTLASLDGELRGISLQIHSHPELAWKEHYAHDVLTAFMAKHGFQVTKHYLGLDTAWRAEFAYSNEENAHHTTGRVLGINAEMDALPLGHACGHNLIAMSGVGVAVAVKAALEAHRVAGKIVILGTPAEEGGGGKVLLLERGGYEEMDTCIMSHPMPGPPHIANLGSTTARYGFQVDFEGHSAHAAASPWEGTNALDAAFMAYSGVSVLRQQMKPTYRVHGIVVRRDEWTPNVIPDHATMRWYVRAPTKDEAAALSEKVKNCFRGAALSTGCKLTINEDIPYYDLQNDETLSDVFTDIAQKYYGIPVGRTSTSASTDFGNVSQTLPCIHPSYCIPTEQGNHTPEFAKAAATPAAHKAAMQITKALAVFGVKFLQDDVLAAKVRHNFLRGQESGVAA